jgi:DNA-binding response OmpR family regulator
MNCQLDEVQRLRIRIAELEEELRQTKATLCPDVNPFAGRFNLSTQMAAILWAIYKSPDICTNDQLCVVMLNYARKDNLDGADIQARAKVRITHARNRLREHGVDVSIQNVWGVGYRIPKADKAKLARILRKRP